MASPAFAPPAKSPRSAPLDLNDLANFPATPARAMNQEAGRLSLLLCELLQAVEDLHCIPELDIYDGRGTHLIPDVVLVSKVPEQGKTLVIGRDTLPTLVVEFTSDGRKDIDHLKKVKQYRQWGIPHYLIVDMQLRFLRYLSLAGDDRIVPANRTKLTILPGVEVAWDGTPTGMQLWMDGKEYFRVKKERRDKERERRWRERERAEKEWERAEKVRAQAEIEELKAKLKELESRQ